MNRILSAAVKLNTTTTSLVRFFGYNSHLLTEYSSLSFKPLPASRSSHHRAVNDVKTQQVNEKEETIEFGVGGKYVELDKAGGGGRSFRVVDQSYKATKMTKTGYNNKNTDQTKDESDSFGTLAQDPAQILEQSGLDLTVDYTRTSVDMKGVRDEQEHKEEEEMEKKYDQVFNHIRLKNGPEHHNAEWDYVKQLQPLLEANKTKEALDFFFFQMIEKDRFKPTLYLFKMMIQHTAQIGYTHMTFSLFKKLTSLHEDDWSRPSVKLHKIMTLLFLACARSPFPEYAIQKTDAIRRYLTQRSIQINQKTYAAMIQAYGRQGAVYEAFNVVDEMLAKKLKLDSSVFANLMSACLSSPEYGFKYALMTWQMSLKYKIKPDVRMFHLLLKAVDDCHATGVVASVKTLSGRRNLNQFKRLPSKTEKPTGPLDESAVNVKSETVDELMREDNEEKEAASSSDVVVLAESDVKLMDERQEMADKLTEQIMKLEWWQDIRSNIDHTELRTHLERIKNPELREAIIQNATKSTINYVDSNSGAVLVKKHDQNAIQNLINDQLSSKKDDKKKSGDLRPSGAKRQGDRATDTSVNRLKLLGDARGVFEALSQFNVKPDCKLFNIMIQIFPCEDVENESILMEYMSKHQVKPDIDFVNFLIKRCILRRNYQEADQAFELIQKNGLVPNIRTFGSLAYRVHSPHHLKELFANMHSFGLKVNERITSTLYSIGFKRGNSLYLSHLVNHLIEHQIEISDHLLKKMDSDLKSVQSSLVEMERRNLNDKEEEEHQRMNKFYETLKDLRQRLREQGRMPRQVPTHPYSRLARADMPLFKSHLRMTRDLKVNHDV